MPKGHYTGKRGFACMSIEKRSAIAQAGGQIAHAIGRVHKWTKNEAGSPGRIGGTRSKRK